MLDYNKIAFNIRENLENYIRSNQIASLVIGVSGGIDSTLCCALARPVCEKTGINLIGVSLPIRTNQADEIQRAKDTGEAFCSFFREVLLENMFVPWEEAEKDNSQNQNQRSYKIRTGNIKARLRMIYLYDLARRNSGIVLSTDNYTELVLGFWTLHGDVGDYGMIQNLWKTEVYELAEHLSESSEDGKVKSALNAAIQAVPTDGLGITDSDLDQLGLSTYKEVDETLQRYFNITNVHYDDVKKEMEDNPVISRYLRTEFKRNNPYNIPRENIIKGAQQ